jgi:hypothetical protein
MTLNVDIKCAGFGARGGPQAHGHSFFNYVATLRGSSRILKDRHGCEHAPKAEPLVERFFAWHRVENDFAVPLALVHQPLHHGLAQDHPPGVWATRPRRRCRRSLPHRPTHDRQPPAHRFHAQTSDNGCCQTPFSTARAPCRPAARGDTGRSAPASPHHPARQTIPASGLLQCSLSWLEHHHIAITPILAHACNHVWDEPGRSQWGDDCGTCAGGPISTRTATAGNTEHTNLGARAN